MQYTTLLIFKPHIIILHTVTQAETNRYTLQGCYEIN